MITRFFLYFTARHTAERAAQLLHARGYETETGLGWDDPFWNTVARRRLEDGDVEHADQQMRELVASLGGDYGGYDQRPVPELPAA